MKNDLAKKITTKIEREKIQMKPKSWFYLATTLMLVGGLIAVGCASFLLSMVTLRISLEWSGACWRIKEIFNQQFWQNFPIIESFLAGSLMIIGFKIFKKFDFSYQVKQVWFIGSFLVIILMITTLISLLDPWQIKNNSCNRVNENSHQCQSQSACKKN